MKKTGDIVKVLLGVKNMNQSDLSRMLHTSTQDVSQKVSVNKDMKVQEFVRYLDAMGFDIVITDRNENGYRSSIKKI